MHDDIKKSSITTLNIFAIKDILEFFATHKELAEILIEHRKVNRQVKHGSEYLNTVLGALLNISILPTNPLEPCEFFTDIVDNVIAFYFIINNSLQNTLTLGNQSKHRTNCMVQRLRINKNYSKHFPLTSKM